MSVAGVLLVAAAAAALPWRLGGGGAVATAGGGVGIVAGVVAVVVFVWPRSAQPADRAPSGREPIRVREFRPEWARIHVAIAADRGSGEPVGEGGDSSGRLPAYVARDRDVELRRRLRQAARRGEFVLLVGESSVGKTRSLYEALRAELGNWMVVRPSTAAEVRELATGRSPRRCVVWLDELQEFLPPGGGGLRVEDLVALLRRHHPVVGAMWPGHYTARTARPEPGADLAGTAPYAHARAVLELAGEPIRLAAELSPAEQAEARRQAEHDTRLAVALAVPGYGMTQVLAGAPELIRLYETADPYARAVLDAAIDARRLGHHTPLPEALLREAAVGYLPPHVHATTAPDWFDTALHATTRRLTGDVRALEPSPGRTVGIPLGYTVTDYLLQHGERTRAAALVPASTWDALTQHTTQAEDLRRLADAARDRMLYTYAEPLYRRAVRACARWT